MRMKRLFVNIIIYSCVLSLTGCSSVPAREGAAYFEKLYRRIHYETRGPYRTVNIFYATSRKMKGKSNSLRAFSPKFGKETSYGVANVNINPKLKIGKMMPAWYKKKDIIGLQDIERLKEKDFMEALAAAVENSPHKSLLVLAMGYKDNFEYTTIKASYFAYLLDIDTPVLLFDWPGDQGVSIRGYLRSRKLAKESGVFMGELLAKIVRQIKPGKIWIQSSSIGCQVVCSAFEYMYKHDDLSDPEHEIDHVILAAPDVGEKEFDAQFKNELVSLSKKLTAYVSSDDKALLISEIIEGEKKFGRQTTQINKHEQLNETKDLLYLKSLEPDKFSIVDVTPINVASYRHGYYLESPEYFDDFYIRILDNPPHTNRRIYLLKTKDSADYWVLRK